MRRFIRIQSWKFSYKSLASEMLRIIRRIRANVAGAISESVNELWQGVLPGAEGTASPAYE